MNSSACSLQKNSCSTGRLSRNLSLTERALSFGGGLFMAAAGARRGGVTGVLGIGLGGGLLFRAVTGHCELKSQLRGEAEKRESHVAVAAQQGVNAEATVLINRPAPELFAFWKNVENLPQVLRHVTCVKQIEDQKLRWTANGIWGELNWETETLGDRENELLAWRSLPGGDLETAGSLRFKPSGTRGTAVTLNVRYNPPGGKIADYVASFLGNGLDDQIHDDLLNFKRLAETGELPRIKADDPADIRQKASSTTSMFIAAQ